ncbi:MAG: patatin-like phospholipase family protein [Deltaproteobacteria bacterium]|jgi:hypothetical protein|nr:patatin-like phospholipase family protein [Deltaproteobacteria bacterium]
MNKSRFILPLLLISSLFSCTATQKETKVHPNELYEETIVDLSSYKSSQERNGQDKRFRVAVAISGGGHRAANFGIGALLGLEEIKTNDIVGNNALSQVDMFSTVSGGGFAAGLYISTLSDYFAYCGESGEYSLMEVMAEDCSSKCFDPNASRQIERGYKDNITSFLNPFKISSWRVWFTDLDRTNLLENAIDDDLLGNKWRQEKNKIAEQVRDSLVLRDIFVPKFEEKPVLLPFWVANSSAFENGALFPFTPQTLFKYKVVGYTHRLKQKKYQGDDLKSEEYKKFLFNFPMSLAMTASGTFPVLLSTTTLDSILDPDNPYLHLLDGGLSDNIGVLSAIRYLNQDNGRNGAEKRLLIIVDAYNGPLCPFSRKREAPSMRKALKKTRSISLNSWRGRYREIVSKLAVENNIKVVVIKADTFNKAEDFDKLYEPENDEIETVINKLKKKWKDKKANGNQNKIIEPSPLDLFRNIATDYNISVKEQKFVIALGRRLVREQAVSIIDALSTE